MITDVVMPQPISAASVSAALNTLVYTSAQSSGTDLYALALVDEFLDDTSFPPNLHDRRYALSCLLVRLITERFEHLAHIFQLALPPEDEPYHEALISIRSHSQRQNPELIGFSWLYYHYVRAELNISMTVFSEACYINKRTLRRYQWHVIRRLTYLLIEREWETRRLRRAAHDSR